MAKIKRIVRPLPWYRKSDVIGVIFVSFVAVAVVCELFVHVLTGYEGRSKVLTLIENWLYL